MIADVNSTRYCRFAHFVVDFLVLLDVHVVALYYGFAELSQFLFGKEFLFFFGTLLTEFVHQREYVFDGRLNICDAGSCKKTNFELNYNVLKLLMINT